MDFAEIERNLTGPGAPFEVVEEDVLGERMPVFKNRKRSLRELLEASAAFGDQEYIVYEGRLVLCRAGHRCRMVRLVGLEAGDFFGDNALIEMRPRNASVVAETEARLYQLTNADLYALYKADLGAYLMVLQNMNRELCRRLDAADARIAELADAAGDEMTQIRRVPSD